MNGPLDNLLEILPPDAREVVGRTTPIPTIAARAGTIASEHPDFVRADIGQISGIDKNIEVLYGPPVGIEPLRAALAEFWTRTFKLDSVPDVGALAPANVAITSGAAEALTLLFRCFGRDKVVGLPRGHWENYKNGVTLANGRAEILDYFDAKGDLDIPGLKRQIDEKQIRLLVVNFPCNPTGAVFDAEQAEALAALARGQDLVIVADEVYSRLRFDGRPPVSLLGFAPERTVVVSSASKEYLLPGARVGYVLSARSELTDVVLRKLIRANTASPNVLGQRSVLELIETDLVDLRAGREPKLLLRIREELRVRKENLVRVLQKHDFTLVGRPGHEPMGTIFLMAGLPPWFSGKDDDEFVELALERHCVSTIPGSAFGIPMSVRFSFGGLTTDAIEKLDRGLTAWREDAESSR